MGKIARPKAFSRPRPGGLRPQKGPGISNKFPGSLQKVSTSTARSAGFPRSFRSVSKRQHSRAAATIIQPQLRPVVEHKGIGGHAPTEARARVRCFKRLQWQTNSRVRPPFVCHGSGGWPRFRKISENTQNVSESFSSERHRVPAQFEVSEYFRMFQKVSIQAFGRPTKRQRKPGSGT